MKPRSKKRGVLLHVTDRVRDTGETKKLRVDVTLHGLPAALVEKLAELRDCPRTEVVRDLVDDAIRNWTVYEQLD